MYTYHRGFGKRDVKEIEKGSSNPPDSGSGFITNPESYESGYDYCTVSSVSSWDISYYTMTSFSSGVYVIQQLQQIWEQHQVEHMIHRLHQV